ncbi:MAG TPA: TIGR03620 family F420-dependent LLM class oxidoreductase [Acidimicrobiales bacterium]|nr:TIGR03620 family F420-dependent LLM class oxidoreductase [Acidimicrobiales bacterium]
MPDTVATWPASLEKLRGTLGLWTLTLDALAPGASAEMAAEIESLGYGALWIPEAWGREAFTNASLLLSSTSSLVIATGIANIWGRDAVTAANGAKTLTAAYDDRFVLGLGVSHEPLVQRLRGHEYAAPLKVMEEFLLAMDKAPMFAEEGATRVARVLAALGPKMLGLAATLTDGAHPYLVTPEHTRSARELLGDKFLGVEQSVVLGQDREEFLRRAHEHLAFYTGLTNYQNSWRRLGFSDEDFVRGGSDRLCDVLVVHGDEDAVLASVNEHRQAGADHVCLQVLGPDRQALPVQEWRRLAGRA